MDLWKSSCDLPYFTAWNDAFYRVICPILHDDMTQIISSFNAICNVFIVQRWRRWTFYSLRLASAYLRLFTIEEINAVSVVPAFQWMYFAIEMPSWCNAVGVIPASQWMYLAIEMPSWCNAVGVMPAFQWMYLAIEMPSWCNAVGVVLLIARGWRGTSLPRVNVCKEIQRHRCWAFFEKAWL